MKVLLIGEFSSLHRYLKEGLLTLGHEVCLVSMGDSWKKIGGQDIFLPNITGNIIRDFYLQYIYTYKIINTLKGYDVVQLIYPIVFHKFINKHFVKKLRENNGILSVVSAGSDYSLVKAYKKKKFDYYMFDGDKSPLNLYDNNTIAGRACIKSAEYVDRYADVIIPSLYEYTLEHNNGNLAKVVPLPINVDSIEYKENIIDSKVVFFHGLNRPEAKGTSYITEALKQLKNNYPEEVEIIIEGKMPFDEYVRKMARTNVVLDQCLSYGYGINACIAMAQGKVVMSGARRETKEAFGFAENIPIVEIVPDVNQIYAQLENLLHNKEQIKCLGLKSRQFVEKYHNYKRVAQQYIDIWSNLK